MENEPTLSPVSEETKLALFELQKLIRKRQSELAQYETIVLKAVLVQRNRNALKAKAKDTISQLRFETLQLQAKMARRSLFHLRERERKICENIGEMPLQLVKDSPPIG